jgi:amino acid adenylation domain-containing protein
MERSPGTIAAFIAILKAGGAYVPLDSEYPRERLQFMMRDTAAPLVLAESSTVHRLPPHSQTRIVCLDSEAAETDMGNDDNVPGTATAEDLAYVMYTSGSMGTPKGVMVSHRAIARLVRDQNYCRFGPDEVFLQLAPISFDASTFEIWGALLNGARLVIMPSGPTALDQIGAAIRRYGVTTLWLTAGLFHLMVDHREKDLASLRQLLAGGDVLSPYHVRKALHVLQRGTVINGYGPTECTTFSCCHRMDNAEDFDSRVPIGRPIAGADVYVLNEALEPVGPDTTGELWIGGDGVAQGYLNHPELTAERFGPDPFIGIPGARMYRTGDRVRQRPDGKLDFLDRFDRQVKIAGHRIEPGEIEAILRQHAKVRQVIVRAVKEGSGEKKLVAYVVATDSQEVTADELRDYLLDRLPKYMIPGAFVFMSALPIGPNGKVDYSALPLPLAGLSQQLPGAETANSNCVTELESVIASIWRRVLGGEPGPDDNFFDLGGDSLLLIEVHATLQKQLNRELNLMDLFEATTVRALARRIGGADAQGHSKNRSVPTGQRPARVTI